MIDTITLFFGQIKLSFMLRIVQRSHASWYPEKASSNQSGACNYLERLEPLKVVIGLNSLAFYLNFPNALLY